MATTSVWKVEGSIRKVLAYIMNPQKTEQQFFVSGVNCTADTAAEEMIATKELHGKTGGIIGFHGYQSFLPGEVTPETAHEIGVKMARELWGERFEIVVSTHLDKSHIHNVRPDRAMSKVEGGTTLQGNAGNNQPNRKAKADTGT